MRSLLCVVAVGCGLAEAEDLFEKALLEVGPAERRVMILSIAKSGEPAAAEFLVRLHGDLEKKTRLLRGELFRLREEMRDLRRQRERAAIAEKLARLEEEDAPRNRRLTDLELEQAAVLEALGGSWSPEARDWFESEGLSRARSPALLHAVALRCRPGPLTEAVAAERRPERIVPLLRALSVEPARSAEPLLRFLVSKDGAVRVAAARALARTARPECVGPLVEALALERPESREQQELAEALRVLTGQKLGPFPDLWRRWWTDHRSGVEAGDVPLGRGAGEFESKGRQGRFYGIPQDANRIVYVLDVSGSMEASLTNPRFVDNAWVPARDDEDSRFDAARKELLRATRSLRRRSAFAVILYADHATALHDELEPAAPESIAALEARLLVEGPGGSTNIYEALDLALRMASAHPESKRGPARADVIFLLSDGSPTNPKGETEDPERTLQAVREWNALQRVTIHAIGIGRRHNAAFMRALASQNGGRYYAVVPRKEPG